MRVLATITGPTGLRGEAKLLVDTGTPFTVVNIELAQVWGLGADRAEAESRLWGPTGPDEGFRVTVPSLHVMGRELVLHRIRCHHFPRRFQVDGLLGLDVLRRGRLTLDLPWGLVAFRWN